MAEYLCLPLLSQVAGTVERNSNSPSWICSQLGSDVTEHLLSDLASETSQSKCLFKRNLPGATVTAKPQQQQPPSRDDAPAVAGHNAKVKAEEGTCLRGVPQASFSSLGTSDERNGTNAAGVSVAAVVSSAKLKIVSSNPAKRSPLKPLPRPPQA
jgi:hypothetical protein